MKGSKALEERIAFGLKQADNGVYIGKVCRKAGVSEATFSAWRDKSACLMASQMRHLRQLEEWNAKLKRLVAELSLHEAMLSNAVSRKLCGLTGAGSSSTTAGARGGSASDGLAACIGRGGRDGTVMDATPITPIWRSG